MKRTLLATAVGLTFIGASAPLCLAQPYGNDGSGQSAQYGQPPSQASPTDDQGTWSGRYWRHERRGGTSDDEAPEPGPQAAGAHWGPPWPPHHPPPPPPPGNAAHFVFQRGPARIDITCPQFFALRDCIQAATELLDKIHRLRGNAMHPGARGGPGDGGGPTPAPGTGNGPQPAPGGAAPPPAAAPGTGGNNQM